MSTKSLQSCPTLSDPTDCSPPGSSVREILQSRILEWVAMPFSRGSSRPRDWSCVSYVSRMGRWVLYHYHHLGSLRSINQISKHIVSFGFTIMVSLIWVQLSSFLEKEMATHSSILAWEIPWTEVSMGLQRVRHNLVVKQESPFYWRTN